MDGHKRACFRWLVVRPLIICMHVLLASRFVSSLDAQRYAPHMLTHETFVQQLVEQANSAVIACVAFPLSSWASLVVA